MQCASDGALAGPLIEQSTWIVSSDTEVLITVPIIALKLC